MQQRVYIVQTPVRDTSRCDQPWSSASLTHEQAYHKTSSKKQLVNAESDYVQAWGKRTSPWTSANITPALFRASTRHHLLYSEPPTVYRGKHVVSRYLRRSHLKANEVSKGEGTMKVKYAYHFQKCADAVDWNYQNWSMLVEATACQRSCDTVESVVHVPVLCSFVCPYICQILAI